MPRYNAILNLPGFTVKKVSGYEPVVFDLHYHRKVKCPHCDGKNLRKKDSFMREIWHELFGFRRTLLRLKAHKFYCRSCQRYFNQRFPGILKYQRATERLKQQLSQYHSQGISQKALAANAKLGKATIERWYHRYYWRLNQTLQNRDCPRTLGIDEHRFRQGYATTLCDLAKHRVFDIVQGRSEQNLAQYLKSLPGRDKVKVVCIDLSSSYKSLIRKYFPQAKIVADRFHVIRQLNHQCMQVYQSMEPRIKYQRGLLAAFRSNSENLTPHKQAQRDACFQAFPAIKAVYDFKEALHRLLMHKHQTASACRQLAAEFLQKVEQLKQSPFPPLQTLGKTLYAWREEIACMWRFTKNNGITEGFHRKMKLIQRRAYGFKNFENYRLRVRVLCS